MKFLCVSCDEAMKLIEVAPPERGSLTVVYRCPKCAHEFAMLTNPFETQVVGSLGVNIGEAPDQTEGESRCPFTSMVQDAEAGPQDSGSELTWSPEASSRLDNIPEFARPMAKAGIEKFAKEQGVGQIDVGVLDRARNFLGM
ncbi:MAG: PCP reductase family protein [Deltaproteobacteria bacterium]|nr:PCP reductase family protein [Deltaproteobacteria bacterium]